MINPSQAGSKARLSGGEDMAIIVGTVTAKTSP